MTGIGELPLRMKREDAESLWKWLQEVAPDAHFHDADDKTILHATTCTDRCVPPPAEPHFLYAVDHNSPQEAHSHTQTPGEVALRRRHGANGHTDVESVASDVTEMLKAFT